jgi:putative iron-only hydrogenase system regulator
VWLLLGDFINPYRSFFIDVKEEVIVENRIALIGIIVEEITASKEVNQILHEYSEHIIGRMGLPYKEKSISIISIVLDADNDMISSLSGKLGMVKGISVKTMYSKSGK